LRLPTCLAYGAPNLYTHGATNLSRLWRYQPDIATMLPTCRAYGATYMTSLLDASDLSSLRDFF